MRYLIALVGTFVALASLSPRVSRLQVQQAPQSFPPLSSYDAFAGNLDMLSGYLGGNVRYSLPSLLEFTVVKIF